MEPRSSTHPTLIAAVAALLLLPTAPDSGSAAGVATVILTATPGSVMPGEVAEVEIFVQTDRPLGAYSVDVECDPDLFSIESLRGGATVEFSGPPFSNVSDCSARLSGFQVVSLIAPTGLISVVRLDLRAAADAVPTVASLVDLTVRSVNDTNSAPIDAIDVDASVSVGPVCGDGLLDPGETCDDGDDQWSLGESCNTLCRVVACGDPNDSGFTSATDALFTLRASVGLEACAPCVCDVNDSGGLPNASDALHLLRFSTGAGTAPICPACA